MICLEKGCQGWKFNSHKEFSFMFRFEELEIWKRCPYCGVLEKDADVVVCLKMIHILSHTKKVVHVVWHCF